MCIRDRCQAVERTGKALLRAVARDGESIRRLRELGTATIDDIRGVDQARTRRIAIDLECKTLEPHGHRAGDPPQHALTFRIRGSGQRYQGDVYKRQEVYQEID